MPPAGYPPKPECNHRLARYLDSLLAYWRVKVLVAILGFWESVRRLGVATCAIGGLTPRPFPLRCGMALALHFGQGGAPADGLQPHRQQGAAAGGRRRDVRRLAGGGGQGVRRGMHHGGLPGGRAACHPRRRRRHPAEPEARGAAGGLHNDGASAGQGDGRGGGGARLWRGGRPRVGRRCGRSQRRAEHHVWRACRCVRVRAAAAACAGYTAADGCARRGAADQDGQPDRHRDVHGRYPVIRIHTAPH